MKTLKGLPPFQLENFVLQSPCVLKICRRHQCWWGMLVTEVVVDFTSNLSSINWNIGNCIPTDYIIHLSSFRTEMACACEMTQGVGLRRIKKYWWFNLADRLCEIVLRVQFILNSAILKYIQIKRRRIFLIV